MTTDPWLLTMKPSFLNECIALPPKELAQIQKKLVQLAQDPLPDGKVKKQLKHMEGKLHRLRSGDYRVFYTIGKPYVSLLALRRRAEDTYDEEHDAELLGGLDGGDSLGEGASGATWKRWLEPSKAPLAAKLPHPINVAMLKALGIPAAHHAALTQVTTEEELIEANVPPDLLSRVLDVVFERPLSQVSAQPDLVVSEPDDLLKFQQRELLGFLLRLNEEQEKLIGWAVGSKSATLLKGGPGTGKSTVALYRVRAMLALLAKNKTAVAPAPRVLFTTYTRALTRVSEQLLGSLLGDRASSVHVRTADAVVRELLGSTGTIAKPEELRKLLAQAIDKAKFIGNTLQAAAQRQGIARLERDFLLEEIEGVIEARQIATLDEYLAAPRPGRGLPLSKTQREAVWRVREALVTLLATAHLSTWEQLRSRAATRVMSGEVPPTYDAVVIDEAQDLQPSVLRMLVGLCKTPGGVFLTADANQSIYGGGFRWQDVHGWLSFQGKTAILRANHRSTREIGEAAEIYLAEGKGGGSIDAERPEPRYVHQGALPAARSVKTEANEAKLLARFFKSAAKELRLGLGACAVLCPFNKEAGRIAAALTDLGVPARKVDAQELDLTQQGVKVMTLKSAKGLEFPVVALAGFLNEAYPYAPVGQSDEERGASVERERRTMYVAMTRAMRALLVVTPSATTSPLLRGFTAPRWNTGAAESPKNEA